MSRRLNGTRGTLRSEWSGLADYANLLVPLCSDQDNQTNPQNATRMLKCHTYFPILQKQRILIELPL